MKELEKNILAMISEDLELDPRHEISKHREKIRSGLRELHAAPFGDFSPDFILESNLRKYLILRSFPGNSNAVFLLRLDIENYLVANATDGYPLLNSIARRVSAILKDYVELSDRMELFSRDFIRKVYASGNAVLVNLFQQLLPTPRPEILSQASENLEPTTQQIMASLAKNPNVIAKTILKKQRAFRANRRQTSEKTRIANLYQDYIADSGKTLEELMHDANRPYMPQGCEAQLATRIYNAAKKIKLYSSVRHLTATSSLTSVLNDGLYGRQTLEQFYMPFESAALKYSDVVDGDFNVICFGVDKIDFSAVQKDGVEITLDLEKLDPKNPCIFYKQMDFGFDPTVSSRKVKLGETELVFTQTRTFSLAKKENACLQLLDGEYAYAYAQLPKFQVISYNFRKMHQILICNFFRFLDRLQDVKYRLPAKQIIDEIYSKIAALNDEQLDAFLKDVGTHLSDSSEFNFYGAHQIDFDSMIKISRNPRYGMYGQTYAVDLPEFISKLQQGDLATLEEVSHAIPTLFQSYRFVDFLLTKVNNEAIKVVLQKLRSACMIPAWLELKKNTASVSLATSSYSLANQRNMSCTTRMYSEEGMCIAESVPRLSTSSF